MGYKTREITEKVPVEKTIIEMKAHIKKTKIPVEKVVIDYIPVKKEIVYKPKITTVKSWDYLPIEKTVNKVEYEEIHK